MVGLWDKFKQTAKDAGEKIAKETKELAQTTKIKMEISGLEGKIKSAIQELGKIVYDLNAQGKSSEDIIAAIKEVDEKVKALEAEIATKKEELSKVGVEEPKE